MNRYKMKGVLLVLVLFSLSLVTVSTAAAYPGGGSRLGVATGFHNWVLIYRPGNWDFKGGYDFTEGNEYIFLSGAYRFVDQHPIAGPLRFSLGAGGYGQLMFGDQAESVVVGGLHIPVGLSLLVLDGFLEFFAEVAPEVDLYPSPSFSAEEIQAWVGITLAID